MIFGIINKEWLVELQETVIYFLVGIKTFEISAYTTNCNKVGIEKSKSKKLNRN